MNKCKICEKEFEHWRQLRGHDNASHRPDVQKKMCKTRHKKIAEKYEKRMKIKKKCPKCGTSFVVYRFRRDEIPKREQQFCKQSCANSKVFTKEQNKSKGRSGSENHNWKGIVYHCKNCGKEIQKRKHQLCRNCLNSSNEYRELCSKSAVKKSVRHGKAYTKCTLFYDGKRIECDSKLEAAGYVYLARLGEKQINNVVDYIEYEFDGVPLHFFPDYVTEHFLAEVKSTISDYQSKKWRSYKEKIPAKKEALERKAEELNKIPLWIDRDNKEFNQIYNEYFLGKKQTVFAIVK